MRKSQMLAALCAVLLGFTMAAPQAAAEHRSNEILVAMASSKSVCGGNTGKACPGTAPAPTAPVAAPPVTSAPKPVPAPVLSQPAPVIVPQPPAPVTVPQQLAPSSTAPTAPITVVVPSAPVASTPPASTVTPSSTSLLAKGDRVEVKKGSIALNILDAISGNFLGQQLELAVGTVTGTPQSSGGRNWVYVDYDSGFDGWSTDGSLVKVIAGTQPATTNTPPQVSQISADAADVDPATAGLQFYENTTVKYSGSASDADGDPLNWKWIYTKNGGSEITYTSGTGAVQPATFTYGTGTAGTKYHWILRVDDKKATTESALDVSIISKPVVPTTPTPTPITTPTSTPAPTSVSPLTSAAIPSTGLVGYWKFDEGLGATASDSSGNGNTGALTNGPAWASGKVGQALSFDGVNDYVRAEDSASLDLTTAVTLSVWAKFNAMPTGSTAMSPITKTEGASYGIIANEGGSARIETYFHIAGSYINAGESLSNLAAGQWYHFAATFDGTATKFYRDGVLKQTVTKSGTLSTNNEPLTIGANPDSQGKNFMEFFNGAIDEVRVYNRALSAQEVAALYTAENAGSPANTNTNASVFANTLTASSVDVTSGDKVGQMNQTTPNGKADFHMFISGLRSSPVSKVRITTDTGGIWETPFNGANWIIATQHAAPNGDLWFEQYGSSKFHVKVTYADGTTDETDTVLAASASNNTNSNPTNTNSNPTNTNTNPANTNNSTSTNGGLFAFQRGGPVIYDNDGAIESGFTDEYIMALASAGVIDLRGIISTGTNGEQPPYTPRAEDNIILERQELVAKARRSGLRNLPDVSPGPGVSMSSRRPSSGRIEDTAAFGSKGARLIVNEAQKATPDKPLVVVLGGQGSVVADAYLLDNSIADKVVVAWLVGNRRSSNGLLDAYEYNAYVDSWATYIIFERLRVVVFPVDDAAIAAVPKSRLYELPDTELRQFMLENRWPTGNGTYWEENEDSHVWDVEGAIPLTRSDYVTSTKRLSFSHWEADTRWGGRYQLPVWKEDPNGRTTIVMQASPAVATDEWWSRMKDPAAWGSSQGEVPLNGTPWTVPGTIEAENFDFGGTNVSYYDNTNNWTKEEWFTPVRFLEHVDIQPSPTASGGYKVWSAEAGEWIKYTIAVGSANTYTLQVGVASNGAGGTFHVEFNGVDKTGPITVPNTGGWDTWQIVTKSGVLLSAGTQVMRLVMDSNSATNQVGHFDYLKLTSSSNAGAPLSPTPTPVSVPTATPTLSPAGTYSLLASPTSVNAGASVTATWTAPSGSSAKDWVGLYKVGDPNNSFGKWVYTGGLPSGTFTTTVPSTGGSYEFRYLLNDGYTDYARSSAITVAGAPVVVSPPAPSPTPAVTLDFSLINNGSKSVNPGQSAVNGITATQTLNGASAQVITFTTSGLPIGATYSYAPGSCTVNCSTTLTINTSSSSPTGTYTITVSATGGGTTKQTSFTFAVVPAGTASSGTYYVSSGVHGIDANGQPIPAGDDKNSGTDINHPFKTIRHAVQVLKPSETLLVRGGEYDTVNGLVCDVTHSLTSECPVHSDYLIPSGTSWANPVTVKGYQGDFTKAYADDPAQRPNDTPHPIFRRYIASTLAAGGGAVWDSSATDYQMARVSPGHMPLYDECVAWWNSHAPQGRSFPHDCWDGSGNQITGLWWQSGAYGSLQGAVVNVATRYRVIQYIILDGIDIDAEGTTTNGLTHSCYQVCGENGGPYDGPRHMRYQNLEIRNSLASCHNNPGVDESVTEDFQFINTKIHHCGVPFDTNMVGAFVAREHPSARFYHPWYMHGGGNLCDGCETYKSAGTGLGPAGADNIIRNSYVHDNTSQGIIAAGNWQIYNNVFSNNGGSNIQYQGGPLHVYNNTMIAGPRDAGGYGILMNGGGGGLFENNLIYGYNYGIFNQTIDTPNTVRNNLVYVNPSIGRDIYDGDWPDWHSTPMVRQNNITGQDPKFLSTDPTSKDFLKLQPGSPAIGKGFNNGLTTDKAGKPRTDGAIDIGAFEYGN